MTDVITPITIPITAPKGVEAKTAYATKVWELESISNSDTKGRKSILNQSFPIDALKIP